MSDNKNQNWNQEQDKTQNSDQRNEVTGTEQRTGSETGQQDRNQQGTSDWQSGNSNSNLGEQSERGNSDKGTQDI